MRHPLHILLAILLAATHLHAAETTAAVSPAKLAAAIHATVRYPIEHEDFTLPSRVPDNPTVTCHVAWPAAGEDGSRSPRASDLVIYLHYPAESFAGAEQFNRLAAECGFTVCTVWFEHQDPAHVQVLTDHQRSYLFRESGSFEVIQDALVEVRRRHQLPEVPCFAFGNSGGAILGQRLADFAPTLFAGVSGLGGGMYLQTNGSQAVHLALTTLGDVSDTDNDGLVRWETLRDLPCLRVRGMPDWGMRGQRGSLFYHCMCPASFSLGCAWLEALSDLRRNNAGQLPAADLWPYATTRANHGLVVDTTLPGWQSLLGSGPVVHLPSARVAHLWIGQPWLPEELQKSVRWTRPGPAKTLRAVVAECWEDPTDLAQERGGDPTLVQYDRTDWDLLRYADDGCCGLRLSDPAKLRGALGEMQSRTAAAKDLPLVVVLREPGAGDLNAVKRLPGFAGVVAIEEAGRKAPGIDALAALADAGVAVRVVVFAPTAETKHGFGPLADDGPGGHKRPGIVQVLVRSANPRQFDHAQVTQVALELVADAEHARQAALDAKGKPRKERH